MTAQPHQLAAVPEQYRALVPDHGKSPWHPSKKATARVPDPIPVPTVHECGKPVEIAHHTEVYGREYSDWPWMYRCRHCEASVGMHPFTSIPLGTLADKQLRSLRTACKQPFELIWQSGRINRDAAYELLAKHLRLNTEQCHFGLFDTEQCKAARDWAVAWLREAASTKARAQP